MREMSIAVVFAAVACAVWLAAPGHKAPGTSKLGAADGDVLLSMAATETISQAAEAGEPNQPAENTARDESRTDDAPAKEPGGKEEPVKEPPVKEIISGKVLPLHEALTQRGVKNYEEETKGQVVLVTNEGELIPIVPDWRGRAFYQDERLRNREVELVANRRKGVPWIQVLSIYTFDEDGTRNLTDYWCDICSIPMYEIKDCDCCQGPTRLRFRPQDLPK